MKLIPNIFTTTEFTEEERVQGLVFTSIQLAVLQNRRAEIAMSKLAISFDGTSLVKFAQAEAYERGQLDVLTWLVESSDAALKVINS